MLQKSKWRTCHVRQSQTKFSIPPGLSEHCGDRQWCGYRNRDEQFRARGAEEIHAEASALSAGPEVGTAVPELRSVESADGMPGRRRNRQPGRLVHSVPGQELSRKTGDE